MKKVIIGLLSLFFAGQVAMAQPVQDHAVIPMAITVNSILRMNIVSGGNIEFVFNTLADYANGLGESITAGRYRTNVTIASSTIWHLQIYSSGANFAGDGGNIGLGYVGYRVVDNTGTNLIGTNIQPTPAAPGYAILTVAPVTFLASMGTGNAGGTGANNFFINWECATAVGAPVLTPISNSGAISGRYSTNVMLALLPN
jgi:hypothetical protein